MLKVKPHAQVLALEGICSRDCKVLITLKLMLTPGFLCQNYSKYVKTAEPLPVAYVTKLQLLLRGQLNRYRYIFEINHLPYSVACITVLIVWTKTFPF